MLIKRNEIDICINSSENTKGVRSFQVPRFAASRTQKKFISPSQWLLERPCPPPPPPPAPVLVVTVCNRNRDIY